MSPPRDKRSFMPYRHGLAVPVLSSRSPRVIQMTTTRTLAAITAALLMIPSAGLHAQTPDSALAVSRNGESLFRVNINGGAVFGGTYQGNSATGIAVEGAGTRLLWHPGRAAFRAGRIDGTQWDDANIGLSSVAIGESVRASGDYAVALGLRNTAAQTSSFAVGEDNVASGYASVALGYHAHTNTKRGSFVFGDNVTGGTQDSVRAEFPGQALWRLSCGMRIHTNQAMTTGVAFGGPSVNPSVCGPTNQYYGQSNAMISTSTGAYLSNAGIWTNTSDVNRKHLFRTLSGEDVLTRLRSLPIQTWSYRVEDSSVRHLGPTAQDFRAAFGLGNDDKVIGTVDADGVALAGVQALDRRTRQQQAELTAARSEIDKLRAENRELAARLARIEALLTAPKQD